MHRGSQSATTQPLLEISSTRMYTPANQDDDADLAVAVTIESDGGECTSFDDDGSNSSDTDSDAKVELFSLWKIISISSASTGVFFGFALQFSLMLPYAKLLGIPAEWASLVWLCGPLTGMVVQPMVGILSDRCTHPMGRRRPFLFLGVLTSLIGQILIGTCTELGPMLSMGTDGSRVVQICIFILGFWFLDGSGNAILVAARAVLPDLIPLSQRSLAFSIQQAWSSAGLFLGYTIGATQWSQHEWAQHLASASCTSEDCIQLRVCFICLCIVLCSFCTFSAYHSNEKQFVRKVYIQDGGEDEQSDSASVSDNEDSNDESDHALLASPNSSLRGRSPRSSPTGRVSGLGIPDIAVSSVSDESKSGMLLCCSSQNGRDRSLGDNNTSEKGFLVDLWAAAQATNSSMRTVFCVTALSWVGWFGFQIYQSDFVGEEISGGSPDASSPTHALYLQGVRVAASALSLNAVLSWASSLILPHILSCFGPVKVWAWSCVVTSVLLASSYVVQTLDEASVWLVSFALTYTVTNTVPYMLVNKFASSDDQGTSMGLINVAVCVPQLVVSLVGGPLATVMGSDRAVFMFGAFTNVVAAIVCYRGLIAPGSTT